ncbi:MAG: Gfo/Idh/MocA family oxidoreductase [Anaerolineae bacterium]|nr:Gfo/Idh/MocA family oxidoreductase [Anaerolineae bacterium]
MSEEPLRFAVIGVGAIIFGEHRRGLEAINARVVAACDIDEGRGRARADELACPLYTDHRALLADHTPDVVAVMTPHPSHAAIAIDCLDAGCHVLVEKPIGVQPGEADAMIAAADRAHRLLAVNFQQRLRPEVRGARQLLAQGCLGQIQYAHLAVTWTRTAAYYRASSWRGTWRGEGGGVLLNQAPHDLDLLCHLVGMPSRVAAWTRTRLHQIETEDTVSALLEWPGGASGLFHASTAEAGHPATLEIIGTQGRLLLEPGAVTFTRLASDVRDFVVQSQALFDSPELIPEPVALPDDAPGDHVAIYRDLERAIRSGAPVIADGREGRMSLELANAMIYASHQGREVALPLDRDAYAGLLAELRAKGKPVA